MRLQKRQLNKAQRDLTRDKSALERQEKQLVSVILLTDIWFNREIIYYLPEIIIIIKSAIDTPTFCDHHKQINQCFTLLYGELLTSFQSPSVFAVVRGRTNPKFSILSGFFSTRLSTKNVFGENLERRKN